ncbi:Catechol 2,3-dioxygenase [Arboricoccus pini]|uniref:Catechol 2,3-dioxygenase n=2 Tax=Arboricoccus pini TaxID=1963835 RepID=A0A212R7T5_9PROT|nr:Catechol 2,3-dioxygenase [Arboricoccus pini]
MSLVVADFDHLVLNVTDVEASARWYEDVLGMRREEFQGGDGPRLALKFGRRKINLRPADASQKDWFTASEARPGSADLCFLTSTSPAEVMTHLRTLGVSIEAGPTKKQGALGTLDSIYCRDPDGSLIEIASYAGHPVVRR